MMRHSTSVVLASLLLLLTSALSAQELSRDEFHKLWSQGMKLEDDKILDKAMKRGSGHAITFYENCWVQARNGDNERAEVLCDALMASWGRTFENTMTLDKVQRWADGITTSTYSKLQSIRTNSSRLWNDYITNVAPGLIKKDYQSCYEDFIMLAKSAESLGHYMEAAGLWRFAGAVGSKMPGKSIEDREAVVFALEQHLKSRENWGYTFDAHYTKNKAFVKGELLAIEEAKKKAGKRKDEGYDTSAKGIEALVMPNVAAKKYPLKFAALKGWQKELDYGPHGGPVPSYWWLASLSEVGSNRRLNWFLQRDIYLLRRGANKFVVNWSADDDKSSLVVDVGSRAKPSTFYLGTDKTLPYAMFFWLGTDQEMTGIAKCNYSASPKVANIYYRSASSWKAQVEADAIVFYDDDASGKPGDGEPFKGELKSYFLGDAAGSGVAVPLFDSMKVGKGKRSPYSQFVKLASGWHYIKIDGGADVAVRPLNPEYVKFGKVKLSWSGAKATKPDQLVIQGKGDYETAIFDVASGKEIEVPVGEYSVIWGRIVNGKGARVQMAQIYPGEDSSSFLVKAGETFKLDMGGPFQLDFDREGDRNSSISALSIRVREKSGCKLVGMHGISLHCDVMSAKASGKGKKKVGAFVPFTNDQLIGEAARQYNNLGFMVACSPMPKGYQKGELVLSFKLPADGLKVGLFVKKHKFFGKLGTVWK